MGQDLRDMFKSGSGEGLPAGEAGPEKLSNGHKKRFAQKLDENFHACLPCLPDRQAARQGKQGKTKSRNFQWYKIAAVFIVLFGIGFLLLQQTGSSPGENNIASGKELQETPVDTTVFLSDVSPSYKKVEDYYLGTLHTELAQLNVTDENKLLIDSFMAQLAELDQEYKRLNSELAVTGVNDETVSALIENLTLRLDLLFKLKIKLEELQKPEMI